MITPYRSVLPPSNINYLRSSAHLKNQQINIKRPQNGFSAFVRVSQPMKRGTDSPIPAGRCCSTSFSVLGIGVLSRKAIALYGGSTTANRHYQFRSSFYPAGGASSPYSKTRENFGKTYLDPCSAQSFHHTTNSGSSCPFQTANAAPGPP
jgi:hypothetical protein